jgi:hypothetical protein
MQRETSRQLKAAALQPSCPAVAVEDCSHRAGAGCIPVPCLAFGCVALSDARVLAIADLTPPVIACLLAVAPLNVGSLSLNSLLVSPATIAALVGAPRHQQLTRLVVAGVTIATAPVLWLCGTLGCVREASLTGRGAMEVAY